MERVVIVGTGGLAREFAAWFSAACDIAGFSSSDAAEHGRFGLPGRLFTNDMTPADVQTDRAVVAIGSPAAKRALHAKLAQQGFVFPTFVHPTSLVSDNAVLEAGVVVSPHCIVSPGARIGTLAFVNFACGVGHDAEVGRYVQINPGSQLGGFSAIGEGTLVGSGSTVLQGVRVGRDAVVGSGSVVFAQVPDASTVMGNPARRMRALESL